MAGLQTASREVSSARRQQRNLRKQEKLGIRTNTTLCKEERDSTLGKATGDGDGGARRS